MNILEVNNTTNIILWRLNDNLEGEWNGVKVVLGTEVYHVDSLDDTKRYLTIPLETTVIRYLGV